MKDWLARRSLRSAFARGSVICAGVHLQERFFHPGIEAAYTNAAKLSDGLRPHMPIMWVVDGHVLDMHAVTPHPTDTMRHTDISISSYESLLAPEKAAGKIDTVIIHGVYVGACVTQFHLNAVEKLGFNAVFAVDAMNILGPVERQKRFSRQVFGPAVHLCVDEILACQRQVYRPG